MYCHIEVFRSLKPIGRFTESFCNNGIQSGVGASDGILTANHTELKFIACESKG